MEPTFVIHATPSTPMVKFEPAKGKLEIRGRSISDNSGKFYKPLLDDVDKYIINPKSPTIIDIELEYCNNASSKCLLELLKKMEGLPKRGIKVEVNWYHKQGDESGRDSGMDFKAIIRLDVNVVEM